MVNLLPEEMKKGGKEDERFEVQKGKEENKEMKDIKMTTVFKDKPLKKEKKTRVSSSKPWDFIFKKKKKIKKDKSLNNLSRPKEEKKISEPSVDKVLLNKSEDKDKEKREEDVSEGFGVSLMPQQTMIISRVVHSRLLFLIVSIVIILVIFFLSRLYGDWHFGKLESQVEYLKREIVLLEAQTNPLLEDRDNITALTSKATEVKRALDNHTYWSNFFDLLEVHTVPDVYFGDFVASAGGNVQLMATSRDLIYLAQQIIAFNNAPNFIKEVEISNIQVSPEGAGASFNLILVDGIWQR